MSDRAFRFCDVSAGSAAVVDTLQGITRGWVTRNNGLSQAWRVWVPSPRWMDYSGSTPTVRFARPVSDGFRTRQDAAEWLIAHESEYLDIVAELGVR